jgi:hypothetical protein
MGSGMFRKLVFALYLMFFAVLSFTLFPRSYASAGQVEFIPSADTYTDVFDSMSNFGGVNSLKIANCFDAMQEVWLKFNLSHIPDGAVIDNATLKAFPTVVTATHEVSAYHCSDISWGEYTINYMNQPAIDVALDTTFIGMPNKWYSWNVTDAVRNASDGVFNASDVLTIVLKQTEWHTSFHQLQIVSKDTGTACRITLYVHWTDVVPEFPSFLILPLFTITTLLAVIVYRKKHAKISEGPWKFFNEASRF